VASGGVGGAEDGIAQGGGATGSEEFDSLVILP
jgi:hypothetical protein